MRLLSRFSRKKFCSPFPPFPETRTSLTEFPFWIVDVFAGLELFPIEPLLYVLFFPPFFVEFM